MSATWSEDDRRCMQRALDLAARGDYRTGRNPKVGAVLARNGEVLAEAWHEISGGPHAEAALFASLAASATSPDTGASPMEGSTLYVTLEPCDAFEGKRTPSCVEAVLASGVRRVVVAQEDPHPAVAGRSLERMREAGIEVAVGLFEQRARRLNGPFLKWIDLSLPYVTAKWAMSLDGKIATPTGHSKWISGEASRREVHVLRGEVDAVAVGSGTALADDPMLTRRDVAGGDPLRVVLDSRARLPSDSRLARTAREHPVLLVTSDAADSDRVATLEALGVEVLRAGEECVDPARVLEGLAQRDVRHLLLEGGGEVLASFFDAGAIDRVRVYLAPRVLGGEGAPGPVRGAGAQTVAEALELVHLEARTSGEDVLLEGHVVVY